MVPSDLDGDGLTDMFVYNFNTGMWVKCFVDGAGGFKGYTVSAWDPGWTLYTADLNGDGRGDFLVYNRVNGSWVEALSQAGFGGFDYPASGTWEPGLQIHPADLTGDGRTDLVLYNAAGREVSALSRAGGNFDYVATQWDPGWSLYPADFDKDGKTDLFFYNRVTGSGSSVLSDGAGSFRYPLPARWAEWDPGWQIYPADFNNDGRSDLLLYRADGAALKAFNTDQANSGFFEFFIYVEGNLGRAGRSWPRSEPGDAVEDPTKAACSIAPR